MTNTKKQCRQARKNESFDIERQKEVFYEILVDLNNFLNEYLGDVDQAVEPSELLRSLKLFMSGKVKLERKLAKRIEQFESQVKQLDSD